jgi:hypothetical protein
MARWPVRPTVGSQSEPATPSGDPDRLLLRWLGGVVVASNGVVLVLHGPKTVKSRSRATRSASAARNATTCRASSPYQKAVLDVAPGSSTTAEHRPDRGRPLQNPHVM